jgi:hypothetical protein
MTVTNDKEGDKSKYIIGIRVFLNEIYYYIETQKQRNKIMTL